MLVNNAGIGLFAPLEIQPFSDFSRVVEVNLLGHCRVTQKMLPLIRKTNMGRIVNITSIAGKISPPYAAAYCASKYGLEAVSDALRRELRPLNISVSAILPGVARTTFVTNGLTKLDKTLDGLPDVIRDTYKHMNKFYARYAKMSYQISLSPDEVVDSITSALLSSYPQPRYFVGFQSKLLYLLTWVVPDEVGDFLFSVVLRYF